MSKIELINGSCVEEKVDAIVHAANKYLMSGEGVCGAIFNKAGHIELSNACKEIKTTLKDGEAVITPAFNITNAKNNVTNIIKNEITVVVLYAKTSADSETVIFFGGLPIKNANIVAQNAWILNAFSIVTANLGYKLPSIFLSIV